MVANCTGFELDAYNASICKMYSGIERAGFTERDGCHTYLRCKYW